MAELDVLLSGKTKVTEVPPWLYTEAGPCGLTKAAFLWWANVTAMAFHLMLAAASVVVATLDGSSMATPTLTVYLTNLTFNRNSTNMLVPEYKEAGSLYLAWLVLLFFLLSAMAHGTVAVLNYRQGLFGLDQKMRKVTRWTGWYFVNVHACRNPLRYVPS